MRVRRVHCRSVLVSEALLDWSIHNLSAREQPRAQDGQKDQEACGDVPGYGSQASELQLVSNNIFS